MLNTPHQNCQDRILTTYETLLLLLRLKSLLLWSKTHSTFSSSAWHAKKSYGIDKSTTWYIMTAQIILLRMYAYVCMYIRRYSMYNVFSQSKNTWGTYHSQITNCVMKFLTILTALLNIINSQYALLKKVVNYWIRECNSTPCVGMSGQKSFISTNYTLAWVENL